MKDLELVPTDVLLQELLSRSTEAVVILCSTDAPHRKVEWLERGDIHICLGLLTDIESHLVEKARETARGSFNQEWLGEGD